MTGPVAVAVTSAMLAVFDYGRAMRMLFSVDGDGDGDSGCDIDLDDVYALPPLAAGATHVRAGFVASVDGAAEVDGRSGPLGGSADQRVLRALRWLADVVLVGAGTVRAERYGNIRIPAERRERRQADGLAPVPPLAVVSRRLDFDLRLPLFSGGEVRPLILTTEAAPADRRKALDAVADVIVIGGEKIDFAEALSVLASRGLRRVLCEGGPSVFSALAAAGLVDELCLTVSPLLAGPEASRIVTGAPWETGRRLALRHILEDDGMLFLRYSCHPERG